MNLPYRGENLDRARRLRREMSRPESRLWYDLLRQRPADTRWVRQRPIWKYIADFYCSELGLIIEVDGGTHEGHQFDYDERRTKDLESLGLIVYRIPASEVMNNLEGTSEGLVKFLEELIDSGRKGAWGKRQP